MKLIQNRYIINFEGYRYEGQIAVGAGNPHLVNTPSQNSNTIIHDSSKFFTLELDFIPLTILHSRALIAVGPKAIAAAKDPRLHNYIADP